MLINKFRVYSDDRRPIGQRAAIVNSKYNNDGCSGKDGDQGGREFPKPPVLQKYRKPFRYRRGIRQSLVQQRGLGVGNMLAGIGSSTGPFMSIARHGYLFEPETTNGVFNLAAVEGHGTHRSVKVSQNNIGGNRASGQNRAIRGRAAVAPTIATLRLVV